ncbi:MAG: glycosyltransferase [Abditibacteriales bacterium]|nr:glycosyltransferase [Abditibacteriales bacterium]MDW8366832.1 glycosyltransferase [Abditibacteriales bacterium]
MATLTTPHVAEAIAPTAPPWRLCFLTTTYPDFQGSPRGPFIERLAQRLTERGHHVSVVTARVFTHSPLREAWNGVTVHRFPYPSGERKLIEHDRVPLRAMLPYLLRGTLLTCRVVREQRCDVIHAHWVVPTGLMGAWAAKLTRKPLVVSAHGSDLLVWAKKRGIRALARWTLKQATVCSANSAAMADECRALGVSDDRLHLIYETGVDVTQFHPDVSGVEIRRRYGFHPQDVVALFVGHLTRRKGVDVLLKAFAQTHLPSLRLLIVGDGPEWNPLHTLAAELGVAGRTTFAGAVAWQDLPPYFAACDVFVLPSRSEGMGVVLLEAMASAKPVIGSHVDGIPSLIVPEKNGLLVTAEDDTDLATALSRLAADAALRGRLGAAARQMACEQFAESKQVDAVERLYFMLSKRYGQRSMFDASDH